MEPHVKYDKEDEDQIKNVVVGLQVYREYPGKALSKEEKWIWFVVSCPSSLAYVLQRSLEMAKLKTKLTIDTFRATQSIVPPILAPRIVPIIEGSPTQKPDENCLLNCTTSTGILAL